jgi:hypothetical protein
MLKTCVEPTPRLRGATVLIFDDYLTRQLPGDGGREERVTDENNDAL